MIWLLVFFQFAQANSTCVDLFAVAAPAVNTPSKAVIPATLLEQAKVLAPQAAERATSLETLYVELLKIDIALWETRTPLTEQFVEILRSQFGERYNVPTGERDIRQFYSNAINSLYSRVAWEWKKQTIEELTGTKLGGATLQTAQSLMDTFYTTLGFAERPFSMESVERFFSERSWQTYPWKPVLEIAKRWHESPESKGDFTAFHRWHERQIDLPKVPFEDIQRLFSALVKKSSPVVCCKSEYACAACPHNRAWLKKGEE